jgi:hypothetical protein
MAKGYSVLPRNRNWLFQSVQFVFFPLSFRQVVGSVSILDGGNSGKIKHDKEAYGSSGLESVFYSLVCYRRKMVKIASRFLFHRFLDVGDTRFLKS